MTFQISSPTPILRSPFDPPTCHGITLAGLAEDRLLAVWYACSYETSPDTVIVASEGSSAEAWSPPRIIVDLPLTPVGNPALWRDRLGLHLAYVILAGEQWTSARIVASDSADDGRTWSRPRLLHDRKGLMTRNRPLSTPSGAILLPIYDETTWAPLVLRSEDGGTHWRLFGDTTARGVALQPALALTPDGKILMLSRGRKGRALASWSADDGKSWTASCTLAMPNPNSGLDLTNLSDGSILAAYNHSDSDRLRLDVAVSKDGGAHWSDPTPVAATENGELSYPCLLPDTGQRVHLTYTVNRINFHYRTIDRTESMILEK
jgi:predicted neuraminidase